MTASKKRHPPKRSRQHIPTDDPHELIQKYFRHDRLLNPNADEGESASFKAKVKELSVRYGFEAIELPLSRAIFAASQKHHCWRLMRSLNCAQGFGPAAKAHRLRRLLMQAEQLMWNPMVGNRLFATLCMRSNGMEIAINGFREQIRQLRELADWSAFPANKIKFHCSIDIVYAAQPLLEFWNCSGRKIAIYRSGGKQYSETVYFLSDCINLFEEQVSPRLVISALKEQGKSRQWWTNKILTP